MAPQKASEPSSFSNLSAYADVYPPACDFPIHLKSDRRRLDDPVRETEQRQTIIFVSLLSRLSMALEATIIIEVLFTRNYPNVQSLGVRLNYQMSRDMLCSNFVI